MGERGPIAKREGRQGHSTPVAVDVREVATVEVPPPPAGLRPEIEQQWRDIWDAGGARVVMILDMPALKRLFQYRNRHADITEYLDGLAPADLVTTGSTGQERVHPLAEHVAKLERLILMLEEKLGLTPMARARLGIALAESRRTWQDVAGRKEVSGGTVEVEPSIDDLL